MPLDSPRESPAVRTAPGNLAIDALFAPAERHPERTALLAGDSLYSYAEVASRTASFAARLAGCGIGRGDRVVIALPDSPAFVSAFFGTLCLGAVAVPVAAGASAEEIAHLVLTTGARLMVVHPSSATPVPMNIAVLEADAPQQAGNAPELIPAAAALLAPEALAYILFSSGSTGQAKGIPHRHVDLLHCARAFADGVMGYRPDDVVLCVPKLSFGYALGCNLVFPLLAGSAAILLEPTPTDAVLAAAAERHSPTIFIGQPRNLVGMIEAGASGPYGCLRMAVVAGEKLSPALARRWAETFPKVPLLDGYGTTEANAIFISNTPTASRPGSLGKLLPGYEVRIAREDGETPADSGEVGELWFRGPSACREYWNNPIATADRIRAGWIRTGDLFSCDADGYFFMHGRVDDMLKVGCGEWVAPLAVEAAIQTDARVAECAVIGQPDEYGVIQLKASVLTVAGTRPTPTLRAAIIQAVADAFPEKPSHRLHGVEFVSDFPRTLTGKIDRRRLRSHSQMEFGYQC
jgi:acyl-coenzyme A synthetase/AMP-(fatty) acid ligase